ncbi:MAG: hypothetical protein IPJ27_13415 [Candidatus Accumulibacter sp.]|uniref:Uncharacterized protein n=1 Tax=Candidatus Accumulibacter proximus TaxID=2954385 RepID=A0A935UG37_9PROT|nr:hypothetical protein [Candidatus Accumulibacter proximus]
MTIGRVLFRAGVTAALLFLPIVLAVALVVAALDQVPLVSRGETISQASIAEARRLLASNDPRRLQKGDERTAVIPAALIDAAINHLASRSMGARGAFFLADDTAEVRLTVRVPGVPGPRYMNLRTVFEAAAGEPRIVKASISSLPIPAVLAEWLIALAIRSAGFADDWQVARQAIVRLVFEPDQGNVEVSYIWQPGLLEQARRLAFTPQDIILIEAAQSALTRLLDPYANRANVPVSKVLAPLIACCGDLTPQESRAALLVLASYLTGIKLAVVLPEAAKWPPPRRVQLTLFGRHDSAQHFVVSAALAAWAGEPAANAVGLFKEIQDSRGGSGFSFADLAADRAGTRFGELVAGGSMHLENALRRTLTDAELAPSLDGLPEPLSAADFKHRFGAGENAAYRQVTTEIERRLAALPLYR